MEKYLNEFKVHFVDELKKPKNVAIVVGGLAATYAVYSTVKIYLLRRKYAHIPGPPCPGIVGYFTGNVPDLQKALNEGKVFPELTTKWHDIYGDVFKVQFFNRMIVFTSDRETIRDVLIEKNYPKSDRLGERIGFPLGERFLGFGILTDPEYGRWKHRRSILNTGFHRHVLMTFVDHFNQVTNTLTDKLRSKADGKTVVQLFNELNRTTLDAIALIAFNMNTDAVTQKDSILNSYLSKILHTLMNLAFDPYLRYKPSNYSDVREFRKMIRYLRKIGKDKIMERITAFKNNEHIPDDILSAILTSNKDQELDLEAMVDDFITFFVAGQETTANALAFCFLELGKHPEIVEKAREEIDRVLGQRTDVTYQDVTDLKYCSALFKETLRMFPPVPHIGRKIKDKMTANGVELPKDTVVLISTFMNGRSEKFFKNPLEFKPERFLKTEDNDSGIENYVYLPFSLGPRNCIGQTFAQLEGVVVIAKMLQKFDLRLDPTQSLAMEQALTLRPKDGTRCFLTLRNS